MAMSGLFYNLGRRLGRAAIPTLRKSKWAWQSLTGTEDEVLQAETAFGCSLATELRAVTVPSRHSESNRQLTEIAQRLQRAVNDKRRAFRVEAIQMDAANAMALPGGFIFVTEPLIEFCGRQSDELAFIIGHEMAHVIRRHAWDRLVNQTATRVASAVALRAGPLGHWLRQTGLGLLQNAHSRDAEAEADLLGLRLAAQAGFHPGGAVTLFRRLDKLQPDLAASLGVYFSSHPPAAQRLDALLPLCQKLDAGSG